MHRQETARVDCSRDEGQGKPKMSVGGCGAPSPGEAPDIFDRHLFTLVSRI